MTEALPRRRFLIGAAAGTAAVTTAGAFAAPDQALAAPEGAPQAAPRAPAPATAPAASAPEYVPEPMQVLTAAEAAFIGAAADAIIPADDLSPSGSDCGVVTYIDRQLAGAYGAGARLYRSGPFSTPQPGTGNQSPLAPLEFFRAGIAAANTWVKATYGKELDGLDGPQVAEALKAMDAGKAEFAAIGSKPFFNALLQMVMEGFFSDPMYGGNRGMASWRMIGYPGLPATYADKIETYRGKRYEAEPQSIADFS
ncbi:gluconate 2-dehydrogenase subunit 3 family protein [Skermanella rosea]|uniref:gluconate 2-dehydrogenase subunit 3 family protein n=1 Tax=Skermanella rosea TaxID=1817965 RepID=UPI001931E562|nr:gluconate 2-dehydrogenase subunit 3 family protein [Skermanella rosea]UEM03484.1 gluconate 2-dehydrogenase subunit 3 family protein [Skermanella rosea]